MPSVYKRIQQFNAGRLPEYTALKMQFMTENAFRFFRGTCHLFYEDLSAHISWKDNTRTWSCGDLHLENFGSYKGDNGIVYFDLNDFDESIQAPATWELSRFLTSIYVGASVAGYTDKDADHLCRKALQVYQDTLAKGKPVIVEKQTASGLLRYFLQQVQQRKPADFLKTRVVTDKKKKPALLIDHKKTYPVAEAVKEQVAQAIHQWLGKNISERKIKVADIAFRIAGTGSVGVARYIVLLEEGNKQHLLDVKESCASSLRPHSPVRQPKWKSEAERIVLLQERIQQVAPKMLHTLKVGKKDFVMKMLQPTQDRMDLGLCKGRLEDLENIIGTMARLTASGHLRSGGRQRSSIADELIAFAGKGNKWSSKVLRYAKQYAAQVQADYESYVADYKRYSGQAMPGGKKKGGR